MLLCTASYTCLCVQSYMFVCTVIHACVYSHTYLFVYLCEKHDKKKPQLANLVCKTCFCDNLHQVGHNPKIGKPNNLKVFKSK